MKNLHLLWLLLISSPLYANEIYYWVDNHGIPHYSDKKNNQYPIRAIAPKSINTMEPPPQKHDIPASAPQKRSSTLTSTTSTIDLKRCEKHLQRLDKLRHRLRAGYSASQAPNLLNQERELKARYFAECREKP